MFTEFFYVLRNRKVPVSITEWMTLMEALSEGYIHNLEGFYFVARAILVKSESHYDHYDVAFQEYFNGLEAPLEIPDNVMEWLKTELVRQGATPKDVQGLTLEDLLKELEKRLREQHEQHDGGGHWIGRFGTSPFGHSGRHPTGIRIGGKSMGRQAMKIAGERRFANYRSDLALDVRQTKMALKRLRQLDRVGPASELDLDKTVERTARNYGELDFVWRRVRKNTVKVLLLMDAGGSMDPYILLCSRLFSAAHSSTHFKAFQYYYFHNCIYDTLYHDMERQVGVSTDHILRTLEPDYKVMFVGDAAMHPAELLDRYGAINHMYSSETPGIVWLKRIADHFTHCVWLNPEESAHQSSITARAIGRIIPMYHLSLDGLDQALRKLAVRR